MEDLESGGPPHSVTGVAGRPRLCAASWGRTTATCSPLGVTQGLHFGIASIFKLKNYDRGTHCSLLLFLSSTSTYFFFKTIDQIDD